MGSWWIYRCSDSLNDDLFRLTLSQRCQKNYSTLLQKSHIYSCTKTARWAYRHGYTLKVTLPMPDFYEILVQNWVERVAECRFTLGKKVLIYCPVSRFAHLLCCVTFVRSLPQPTAFHMLKLPWRNVKWFGAYFRSLFCKKCYRFCFTICQTDFFLKPRLHFVKASWLNNK